MFSKLSAEVIEKIGEYLRPSEKLNLSIAISKARFLRPDFDEIVINRKDCLDGQTVRPRTEWPPYHNAGNQGQMKRVLDVWPIRKVNQVTVSLLRSRGLLCQSWFCTKGESTIAGISGIPFCCTKDYKENGWRGEMFSTRRSDIFLQGQRISVDVNEGKCCEIVQAEIKVFYAEKLAPSFISKRINPLNIRTNLENWLDVDTDSDSYADADLPSVPDMDSDSGAVSSGYADSDVDSDSNCSCCSDCINCFCYEYGSLMPEVHKKIPNWFQELEHPYVD